MKEWLIKNPLGRTVVFLFSVILTGILCSAFIAEISSSQPLRWGDFYKTKSFWVLSILLPLVFGYNYFSYKEDPYEQKYRKKLLDDVYPVMIEEAKKKIKKGEAKEVAQDVDEFINSLLGKR